MEIKHLTKYTMCALLVSMAGFTIPAYSGIENLQSRSPQQVQTADTLEIDTANAKRVNVVAQIHMLARSYGDSIVLRWAGEDYVTQQNLYRTGVTIYRFDSQGNIKVLVEGLKPWTVEQLHAYYPMNDSVALMAMELMSGKRMGTDQTRNRPGTMGAMLELHDDQQARFGFSVLLSEWRPDLADKMAMRWVDRDVVPGETYEYTLQPSEINPNANIVMGSGHIHSIVNNPHTREKLDIIIGDSIVGPLSTRLWWNGTKYSSFEIERKAENETEWTRINDRTILSFSTADGQDFQCMDNVPSPGLYQYRIFAHDPFGDLTQPSQPYTMTMPDYTGPQSPVIRQIVIDRRDPEDLSKDVFASIHFSCDSIVDDFEGYMPVYFHKQLTKGEWVNLSKEKYGVTDTVITLDVTGLSTGMVAIGASDKSGNVSYSMPMLMVLQDAKAPNAPRNLQAFTNAKEGLIKLLWECDDDDVEYFEVQMANDTTHEFMNISREKSSQCIFVDTVDMEVNQKYAYYRVRAIDYSTNVGAFTPILPVIRPCNVAPSAAHLESSRVEQDGIHLCWGLGDDQQTNFHILVRRAENEKQWTVIRRWNQDSLQGGDHIVEVVDRPKYNRQHSYIYGVTSVGLNGLHTTSMMVALDYKGDAYFDWKINLEGRYDRDEHMVRLAFDTTTELPYSGDDWFYTIYRKRAGDSEFKFFQSVPNKEVACFDPYLDQGERAEYYVFIQYPDGCQSNPSNTITVKAE